MSSQSPPSTRSESPFYNQHENATQNNQSESPSVEQPVQMDAKVERSPSRQLSDDTFHLGDSDRDNPQEQEHEGAESVDDDYERRACAICRKSGFKGERGLRIHQRNSKECFRIMQNTQRKQSVMSSTVGSGNDDDEDAFSVVSTTRSDASSNEMVDFMDNFIGRISQLTQNRINVVYLRVPQVLVDLLHCFYRKIFNSEALERTQNWLAPRIKRGTTVLGHFVAILVVSLFWIMLLGYIFYCLANGLMHIVYKEQVLALIHELWTHIQRKMAQLSYGIWA